MDRGERRRSSSTGDLQSQIITPNDSDCPVPASVGMRSGPGQHRHRHRTSRSESAMQLQLDLNPPQPAYLTDTARSKMGRGEVHTPQSTLSTSSGLSGLSGLSNMSGLSGLTMGSDETITPHPLRDGTSMSTGTRYENVPLPWSTHPLSTLLPTLPSQYLPIHLDRLLITTPCVLLGPTTFASLSSEEARLQLELDRLKVKHTRLALHRDKILTKSFARLLKVDDTGELVKGVEESIRRVDRVARQIYICNDQLRQMEVMKRDHEMGVLLWALDGDRRRHRGGDQDDFPDRGDEKVGEQDGKEEEEEVDGLAYLHGRDDEVATPVDVDSPNQEYQLHDFDRRPKPSDADSCRQYEFGPTSRCQTQETELPITRASVSDHGLMKGDEEGPRAYVHRPIDGSIMYQAQDAQIRTTQEVVRRPFTPASGSMVVPVPEIHLTRATIYDPSEDVDEEEECEYLVSPSDQDRSHTQLNNNLNYENKEEHETEMKDASSMMTDRPLSSISTLSTGSGSLSPINLGFPLSPSRPWPSIDRITDPILTPASTPTPPIPITCTNLMPITPDRLLADGGSTSYSYSNPPFSGSLEVPYDGHDTPTSTSSSHYYSASASGSGGENRITIYPPSQNHGTLRPISGMPHTPLISEQDHKHDHDRDRKHQHQHQHQQENGNVGDGRPLPSLPPLRTRRSKPDIAIYVPTSHDIRPVERRFRQISIPRRKVPQGGTGPLRLRGKDRGTTGTGTGMGIVGRGGARGNGNGNGNGKYQSKSLRYQSENGLEAQRRGKIMRESGFEGVSLFPYIPLALYIPHSHHPLEESDPQLNS